VCRTQERDAAATAAGQGVNPFSTSVRIQGHILRFILDPKATIRVGNGTTGTPVDDEDATALKAVTATEFVRLLNTPQKDLEDEPLPTPLVWMRHFGGPDGPITSITEQYFS
jgi:hypothetical protein